MFSQICRKGACSPTECVNVVKEEGALYRSWHRDSCTKGKDEMNVGGTEMGRDGSRQLTGARDVPA